MSLSTKIDNFGEISLLRAPRRVSRARHEVRFSVKLTADGDIGSLYATLDEHDDVIEVTPASERSTTTMTITAIVLTSKSKNPLRRAMTIVNEIYRGVGRKVRTDATISTTNRELRVLA